MKKEVCKFREKAINSLVLSIDHFNRPWDRGRPDAVLIFLSHSFEMLFKAVILSLGGRIRKRGESHNMGFDACLRKCLTEGKLRLLNEDQAVALRAINTYRNAAHHGLIELSEHLLYLCAQDGVTLFRDIHDRVFDMKLALNLPDRVLPISTTSPRDLSAIFDDETEEIKEILASKKGKNMDALPKVRSLAILEHAVADSFDYPSDRDLERLCRRLEKGEKWRAIFPGVSTVRLSDDFESPSLCLRVTKNEGVPVRVVRNGEEAAASVIIRRVNELDEYSLSPLELAKKIGLTAPKSRAVVDYINVRGDPKCFKNIEIGRASFPRYTGRAIERMRACLDTMSVDEIWLDYKQRRRK